MVEPAAIRYRAFKRRIASISRFHSINQHVLDGDSPVDGIFAMKYYDVQRNWKKIKPCSMAMTACFAKLLSSSICFALNRPILAVYHDGANQFVFFQHRYSG